MRRATATTRRFCCPPQWRDGAEHLLDLHGWSGLFGDAVDPKTSALFMRPCKVVLIDQPTRDFLITARVALETVTRLDDNDPAKGHLLNALDAAFKLLDTRAPGVRDLDAVSIVPGARTPFGDDFYASVPAAHAALKDGIAKAGPALDVDVIGTGHAHIDVAWLWTLGSHAPEGRAHLLHRAAPDGAVPRIPLHAEPAATLRLRAPGLSRTVRGDQASASPRDAGNRSAACGSRPTAT